MCSKHSYYDIHDLHVKIIILLSTDTVTNLKKNENTCQQKINKSLSFWG